jgi:hypothetical protein
MTGRILAALVDWIAAAAVVAWLLLMLNLLGILSER